MQYREILRSAGAQQDVSRYVRSLPGVAIGADDFRNDIIVRGGSPLENLFIVDNIEVPNINTFANFASAGGTVGILDAALIQDVSFPRGSNCSPIRSSPQNGMGRQTCHFPRPDRQVLMVCGARPPLATPESST